MADIEIDPKTGNPIRKKDTPITEINKQNPPSVDPPDITDKKAKPNLNPDFPKKTSDDFTAGTNVTNLPAATPSVRDVAIMEGDKAKRNAGVEPDHKIVASQKDPAKLQKIENILRDGGMDSASVIRSLQRIDEILWPNLPETK